ncbi:hypothetical protein EJ08DRAFT_574934, partial [Tothia fuscella]
SSNSTAAPSQPSPRWLSETKSRIGKCITFGLESSQVSTAGAILAELGRNWRELIAGSEGYLTQEGRRGLWRHEVVWGEMDSMGHVNNVMYNRYAESGRVNWAANFTAATTDPAQRLEWSQLGKSVGIGMILRGIATEFKFPMTWPDHITVLHKLHTKPEDNADHFVLDVLILSELHQRPAARCKEDIVIYDYRKGRKAALKPHMVEAFQKTFEYQEEARKRNSKRMEEISERVRELEEASWDRVGAVEKFG